MEFMQAITKYTRFFTREPLTLLNGEILKNIQIAYQTYGKLNSTKDNVVWVCHALTGNAHAAGIITGEELDNSADEEFLLKYNKMNYEKTGWWDTLIGPGKLFDTDKYFIVCSNLLSSCYGTAGPSSINTETNKKYSMSFPVITIRDMVRVQKELADYLEIKKINILTGGSLGGMQVLEWALMYPEFTENIIPIATSAAHSAWATALNEVARNSILNDPAWENGEYTSQPLSGLADARKVAMISYRSMSSFQQKFSRSRLDGEHALNPSNKFKIQTYLDYQGQKLVDRFDANTYIYLTWAMDIHDVGYMRGGTEAALGSIKNKTLCIGIDSDILYPADEQKQISALIPNSTYSEIKSVHGHDAFLIEFDQVENIIKDFLGK
jgi:homoserine O-acetyltransferase